MSETLSREPAILSYVASIRRPDDGDGDFRVRVRERMTTVLSIIAIINTLLKVQIVILLKTYIDL